MKILLRAAMTAVSLASIAPAHSEIAKTPPPSPPAAAVASLPMATGPAHVLRAYVTESKRGTWLFAPHDGGGAHG